MHIEIQLGGGAILLLILAYYLFRRIPNNSFTYSPKEGNSLSFIVKERPEDTRQHQLNLRSSVFPKKEQGPVSFQCKYIGPKYLAEKIKKIDIQFLAKDPVLKDFTKAIVPYKTLYSAQLTAQYYYDSPTRKEKVEGEFKDLFLLKHPQNLEQSTNYLFIDVYIPSQLLGNELKVLILLQTESSEYKFSTELERKSVYGAKVRSRPFG